MSEERPAIVVDYGGGAVGKMVVGYALPQRTPLFASTRVVEEEEGTGTTKPEQREWQSRGRFAVVERRVADFDALEACLDNALYKELGWVRGEEGGIFVVEPILASRRERELTCQLAFEKFNCSGYSSENAATAALSGVGRLNGVSVDFGGETVDVAMVSDGKIVGSAARRLTMVGDNFGEKGVEKALRERLDGTTKEMFEKLGLSTRMRAARELARVKTREEEDVRSEKEEMETYALPDGRTLSTQRNDVYEAGESLFREDSRTKENLSSAIVSSVENSFSNAQGHLFANGKEAAFECVVAHGPASCIRGLHERLAEECKMKIAPRMAKVNVVPSTPEYLPEKSIEHLSWTGGAVLAKVAWNLNQQVTKSDYNEWGPNIANRIRG